MAMKEVPYRMVFTMADEMEMNELRISPDDIVMQLVELGWLAPKQ